MSFIKKLTSALVASSLVLGLVGTAFAAPSADDVTNAYNRLNHYSIVQGKAGPTGEVTPALADPITRAELLAILVRAWGQENNAKLLKGATTGFADVDGVAGVEWTTGYIFIGSRIADTNGGQKLGTGSGFNPSGKLTAAETLAFVMKFLGLNAGTGANWVADTIAAAKTAGLITDADEAKYLANPTAAVNRGEAFAMLDNMFASYNKLEGGKTIYTTFIDNKAPELTVNKPELTTDKTAITVTGQVKDYTTLYHGSEAITANADGTFSVEIKLAMGKNDISISAIDRVGNSSEETFSVTRNPGTAAKLVATVPSTNVVAGAAVDVTVKVLDANDVELEVVAADVKGTIGGSVGTYADGKFTAAEKVGTGTLSISYGELTPVTIDVTVVAGPLAKLNADKVSVAKGDTIKLTATDKFDNAIASGVTYTWDATGIAVTDAGVVYTSAAGQYTVTAKAGDATATALVGVYGDIAKLGISAPESITANGATMKAITITALDEFGNKIVTFGTDESTEDVVITSEGVKFFEDEDDTTPSFDSFTADFEDGEAVVYVAFDAALGGEEIGLTATYDADIDATGTIKANIAVATAVKVVSGAPKFLAANGYNTDSVSVEVVDQDGEAVTESYEITAAITGPADLDTTEASYTGTPVAFTINNADSIGVEDTINLTFSVEGVGTATHTMKQVIAGNPAKLVVTADEESVASNESIEFTVEIQDRNGVPVALYDEAVVLEFDEDTTDALTIGAVTLLAGEKSVSFTATAKNEVTGNVTMKVTAAGGDYELTGSKVVSFNAGDVASVALDRDTVIASVADPKGTFKISLKDAKGNAVAKADVEVEVWLSTNAGLATVNGVATSSSDKLTVKTDANGTATLEVKARPYAGYDYTLNVDLVDVADTPDNATLAVDESVVAAISTKLLKAVTVDSQTKYLTATSVKAGEDYYLVATVKDNYGGELTGVASNLVLVATDDTVGNTSDALIQDTAFDDGLFTAYSSSDALHVALGMAAGDYVLNLTGGKAGVTAVGAKYTLTQDTVSRTSSIQQLAGTMTEITINGGEDIEVEGAGKVHGNYTITLSDLHGNTVYSNTSKTLLITGVTKGGLASNALTFRTTSSGATVTELTTKSSSSFYFVATETGTYTVDFEVEGDSSITGSVTIVVE